MQVNISWLEIALRLALAFAAGAIIGFNRGEHGRPAGLRTTILVSLAACVAMLQVNLLLGVVGKHSDSFVVMDLMRLPLGILTGMGFIGGGAILRKGDIVLGVTTAATLWFVTVIGLCFGGGQLVLGVVSTLIGILVLWVLSRVEELMPHDRQGTLILVSTVEGPSESEIRARLGSEQFTVISAGKVYSDNATLRELRLGIQWRTRGKQAKTPSLVEELAYHAAVRKVEWNP